MKLLDSFITYVRRGGLLLASDFIHSSDQQKILLALINQLQPPDARPLVLLDVRIQSSQLTQVQLVYLSLAGQVRRPDVRRILPIILFADSGDQPTNQWKEE